MASPAENEREQTRVWYGNSATVSWSRIAEWKQIQPSIDPIAQLYLAAFDLRFGEGAHKAPPVEDIPGPENRGDD
jgi:hypothetical protein